MKTVYLFYEEGHGLIAVAETLKAGIKYLIDADWIDENTSCLGAFDNYYTVKELFGENWEEEVANLSEEEFYATFKTEFWFIEEDVVTE